MVQKVFNRYEKKYLLTAEEYKRMRQLLEQHMQEDEYGVHTIRNIYYDTDTDELIRTSLEKPKYKEKFRVRCYGAPNGQSAIFLEIKKKYKGLVNKRRIVLSPEEAKAYLEQGKVPAQQSQIFREIDYFLSFHQIVPKVYLAYDRVALYGIEDKEFRVTFDTNIRSRNTDLCLEKDEGNQIVLDSNYYLMEVKISDAMPLWFVHILDELSILPISFSKYGTVYKKQLEERRICTC